MRDVIRDSGLEDEVLCRRAEKIVGGTVTGEDAIDALLEDYINHFRSRQRLMKSFYPLQVIDGNLTLVAGHSHARIYGLLVHCSRLDALKNKSLAHKAAMSFEDISAQVAQIGLGKAFKVHALGTSAFGSSKLFSANKSTSLRRLARWFKEALNERFMKAADGVSGDHGVDIVGKMKMERLGDGCAAFLGQCAASSDESYWKKKKYDMDKVMEVIQFFNPPVKALFIPSYYRRGDGSWHNITSMTSVVLFDRMRLAAVTDPQFIFRHDDVLDELNASFAALAA